MNNGRGNSPSNPKHHRNNFSLTPIVKSSSTQDSQNGVENIVSKTAVEYNSETGNMTLERTLSKSSPEQKNPDETSSDEESSDDEVNTVVEEEDMDEIEWENNLRAKVELTTNNPGLSKQLTLAQVLEAGIDQHIRILRPRLSNLSNNDNLPKNIKLFSTMINPFLLPTEIDPDNKTIITVIKNLAAKESLHKLKTSPEMTALLQAYFLIAQITQLAASEKKIIPSVKNVENELIDLLSQLILHTEGKLNTPNKSTLVASGPFRWSVVKTYNAQLSATQVNTLVDKIIATWKMLNLGNADQAKLFESTAALILGTSLQKSLNKTQLLDLIGYYHKFAKYNPDTQGILHLIDRHYISKCFSDILINRKLAIQLIKQINDRLEFKTNIQTSKALEDLKHHDPLLKELRARGYLFFSSPLLLEIVSAHLLTSNNNSDEEKLFTDMYFKLTNINYKPIDDKTLIAFHETVLRKPLPKNPQEAKESLDFCKKILMTGNTGVIAVEANISGSIDRADYNNPKSFAEILYKKNIISLDGYHKILSLDRENQFKFDPSQKLEDIINAIAKSTQWNRRGFSLITHSNHDYNFFHHHVPTTVGNLAKSDEPINLEGIIKIVKGRTEGITGRFYNFFNIHSPMTKEFYKIILSLGDGKALTEDQQNVAKNLLLSFCYKWKIEVEDVGFLLAKPTATTQPTVAPQDPEIPVGKQEQEPEKRLNP